jgi:hypothetical protein
MAMQDCAFFVDNLSYKKSRCERRAIQYLEVAFCFAVW